jgi:hypothetical protein
MFTAASWILLLPNSASDDCSRSGDGLCLTGAGLAIVDILGTLGPNADRSSTLLVADLVRTL